LVVYFYEPKILKMRYQYYLIIFIAFLSTQCSQPPQQIDSIAIIPKPQQQTVEQGSFEFDENISSNFYFEKPKELNLKIREFIKKSLK